MLLLKSYLCASLRLICGSSSGFLTLSLESSMLLLKSYLCASLRLICGSSSGFLTLSLEPSSSGFFNPQFGVFDALIEVLFVCFVETYLWLLVGVFNPQFGALLVGVFNPHFGVFEAMCPLP
ncbi:unnamed protein product [Linum trigynum]|uniref:Uncharacterized protein n=1 Tax=Linum trigynum TaxID=586398 RepID=A0AAV2CBY6_9ROSI